MSEGYEKSKHQVVLKEETLDDFRKFEIEVRDTGKDQGWWWIITSKCDDLPVLAEKRGKKTYIVTVDADSGEQTYTEASDEQKVAYESDLAARAFLTRALNQLSTFREEVQGKDRNAHDQWEYMQKKFQKKGGVNQWNNLEEEFHNLSPKDYDDAGKYFTALIKKNQDIEAIKPEKKRDDETLRNKAYSGIRKGEQGEVNGWTNFRDQYSGAFGAEALNKMTLEEFQVAYTAHWEAHGNPGKAGLKTTDDTKTLVADASGVICHNCGKPGHKAHQCEERRQFQRGGGRGKGFWRGGRGRGGRPGGRGGYGGRGGGGRREIDRNKVMCFKCHTKGHMAYECPTKKNNEQGGDQNNDDNDRGVALIAITEVDVSAAYIPAPIDEESIAWNAAFHVVSETEEDTVEDTSDDDANESFDAPDNAKDVNATEDKDTEASVSSFSTLDSQFESYESDSDSSVDEDFEAFCKHGDVDVYDRAVEETFERRKRRALRNEKVGLRNDRRQHMLCNSSHLIFDEEYESAYERFQFMDDFDDDSDVDENQHAALCHTVITDVDFSDDSSAEASTDISSDDNNAFADGGESHTVIDPFAFLDNEEDESGDVPVYSGTQSSLPTTMNTMDIRVTDLYLLDTGANVHVTNTLAGLVEVRATNSTVTVGDSNMKQAACIGILPLRTMEGQRFHLRDCRYIANFHRNIISHSLLKDSGCKIIEEDQQHIIFSGPNSLRLKFVRAADKLYYLTATRTNTEVALNAETTTVMNINAAHQLLNHPGHDKLKETAKSFHWKLVGDMQTCTSCSHGKARQKNTKKQTESAPTAPGERLYLDLSGPFTKSQAGNRYIALIVCGCTQRTWHFFLVLKSGLLEKLQPLILSFQNKGFPPKYLRMDNAGENLAVSEWATQHSIVVEMTPPHTPQYNGVVERMFATVKGKATACLSASGVTDKERPKLWAHCIDDVLTVGNLMPRRGFANAYAPFGETPPVKPHDLVPWGCLGEMTLPIKPPTFQNKSESVRRVGYDTNHPSDCYLVQKFSNTQVVSTRNVIWNNDWRLDAQPAAKAAPVAEEATVENPMELSSDSPDEDPSQDAPHLIPPDDDDSHSDAPSIPPEGSDDAQAGGGGQSPEPERCPAWASQTRKKSWHLRVACEAAHQERLLSRTGRTHYLEWCCTARRTSRYLSRATPKCTKSSTRC